MNALTLSRALTPLQSITLLKSNDAAPPATPHHCGFKSLKSAQNWVHLIWFHEFFQPTSAVCIISISGHCKLFIFKICQTVAGISTTGQFHEFFNLIFGGFLLFDPTLPFSSQLMRREHPCSSSVLISDGILPSGGVRDGVGVGGLASTLSNFTLPSRVRRSLELLQVTKLDT